MLLGSKLRFIFSIMVVIPKGVIEKFPKSDSIDYKIFVGIGNSELLSVFLPESHMEKACTFST